MAAPACCKLTRIGVTECVVVAAPPAELADAATCVQQLAAQ